MTWDFYQLVQILYWIALATAFGGVLFIALAAPVIFRTTREAAPTLPAVQSVNLQGQHGTLLAGTIMSNLLLMLGRVQIICAVALLVCMIAQFFVINLDGGNQTAMLIRVTMFGLAVAAGAYDRLAIWPRLQHCRQQYIVHADEPELANQARAKFDHNHQKSVNLLGLVLFLLLGMILFSANITPAAASRSVTSSSAPLSSD